MTSRGALNELVVEGGPPILLHPRPSAASDGTGIQLTGGQAAGTDNDGGDAVLASGASTGAGKARAVVRVADRGASGLFVNTLRDRILVPCARFMVPTSGTRTELFTVSVPTGSVAGVHVDWAVQINHTNGTDLAVVAARSTLCAANPSGTAQASTNDAAVLSQVTQGLAVVTVTSNTTVSGSTVSFGLTPTLVLFAAEAMRAEFMVHVTGGGTLVPT